MKKLYSFSFSIQIISTQKMSLLHTIQQKQAIHTENTDTYKISVAPFCFSNQNRRSVK